MLYFVARYVIDRRDRKRRRHYLTEAGDWQPDREIAATFPGRSAAVASAKLHPGAFVDGVREPRSEVADV